MLDQVGISDLAFTDRKAEQLEFFSISETLVAVITCVLESHFLGQSARTF